jgi:Tol biopolymer transport system component
MNKRLARSATALAGAVLALAALAGCGGGDSTTEATTRATRAGRASPGLVAFSRAAPTIEIAPADVVLPTSQHIFTLDPSSGKIEQLTGGPGRDSWPAWSPDGRTIAFARTTLRGEYPPGSEIFLYSLEDGSVRRLTRCRPPDCESDIQPQFSPDGKRLSFQRASSAGARLGLITLADGSLELIAPPRGLRLASGPTWRSEHELTFVGYERGGKFAGYEATDALTDVRDLDLCAGRAGCRVFNSVSWAEPAGGSQLGAVELDIGNRDIVANGGIFAVRPEGIGDQLAGCEARECPEHPALSPDGRRLLFDRGGDIIELDVVSGEQRRLTSGKRVDCCASWQP